LSFVLNLVKNCLDKSYHHTTKLDEHADDDSSWGELIRIFKGIQSEDELNNIKRRTTNGKRAKAEGRQQDGTIGPKKLVSMMKMAREQDTRLITMLFM